MCIDQLPTKLNLHSLVRIPGCNTMSAVKTVTQKNVIELKKRKGCQGYPKKVYVQESTVELWPIARRNSEDSSWAKSQVCS